MTRFEMETLAFRVSQCIAGADESDHPGATDWLHQYCEGDNVAELLESSCGVLLSMGDTLAMALVSEIEESL